MDPGSMTMGNCNTPLTVLNRLFKQSKKIKEETSGFNYTTVQINQRDA